MFFEDDELERYGVRLGDVLLCEGGEPGRAAVWTDSSKTMFIQKAIHRVRLQGGIVPQWLVLNLRFDSWTNQLGRYFTGATIQHFTGRSLVRYRIRLAPIAEQRRAIAKVDQLMALCDDLEARQAKKRETAVRLNRAALDALTTAEGPEEVAASFRRIAENFEALIHTPESVSGLRNLVLALASRGRLVSQQNSDEPATVLLDEIAIEASSLAIKKSPRSAIVNNVPFALPASWQWVHLESVFRVITDGDHQAPPKATTGIPFLTIGNMSGGTLDFADSRFVSPEYYANLSEVRTPRRGDILYTVVGATYGRPVPVETEREFCVQRHVAILKPWHRTNVRYFHHILKSELVYNQATKGITGTAQPTVPLGPLRKFLVPLPPLAEQKRIVAKVDQLMALCDTLEAALRRAESTAQKLAEAVVVAIVA